MTRNPVTVEFERAQADRAATLARFGRPMKWENPIRTENRRKEMARVEAVLTECTAFDKLPMYSTRADIDWPLVYRNGIKLSPIRPRAAKR